MSSLLPLTLFIIYRKPVFRYLSCTSDEVLANRFNSFFLEKINTLCSSIIGSSDANILCPPLDVSFSKLCFQPVTQDQVSKINQVFNDQEL